MEPVTTAAIMSGITGLLGKLFGGGGGQSNEAVASQLALSKQLMNMLQSQQNVALPYQQGLLGMLQSRAQQQPTVNRPGAQPVFNPFGNTQSPTPGPGGQGVQTSGAQPTANPSQLGPMLRNLLTAPKPGV